VSENEHIIHREKSTLVTLLAIVMLAGCTLTREPLRTREYYFRPITELPQRNRTSVPSAEMQQLKDQLQAATQASKALRDSLSNLQKYASTLLASSRALVDKISDLESKEFLSVRRQKNLEQNVARLQSENNRLSRQFEELRAMVVSGSVSKYAVPTPSRPSLSLRDEYGGGLSLFLHKRYEEAATTFRGLMEKGIEEDLFDNCEYWIGECCFALRRYERAISQFQRVIAISSSNKKADAYFLMGRSYEALKNPEKALWAYKELLINFPLSERARNARMRWERLKRMAPAPKEAGSRKTTA
jgi:TolA-binding protein